MTNAERVVAVSLLGALLVPFAALAQPAASRVDLAEHHEFVIESFRTESGVTLPQARIVYGIGNRSLLPDRRRSVRGAVHSAGHADADPVAVGPHGWRSEQSRRPEVPQRDDRPVPVDV